MAARMRPSRVASAPENAEKRSAGANGPEVDPGDSSAVQAGLPEEREIRRQQMAALIRQTPVISTVSMANSLVTALVFWSVASHPTLITWLCVVWAMALIHLSRWQRYRRRPPGSHVSRRGPRRATIWAFLSGCVWASSLIFFWDAPITYQMVLMIVISGMAAGAATTLASIPSAAAAFVLTSITPFIVFFAIQWDVAYLALALMALVLTMAMLVSAYIVHQQFIESVRTRFENQAQLAQFHAERDDWLEISDTSEAFALFDQDDRLLMWNENYRRILSLPDGDLFRARAGSISCGNAPRRSMSPMARGRSESGSRRSFSCMRRPGDGGRAVCRTDGRSRARAEDRPRPYRHHSYRHHRVKGPRRCADRRPGGGGAGQCRQVGVPGQYES